MPVFESSADDVLGLWMNIPFTGAVSFGLGEENATQDEQVYRAHLPASDSAAQEIFEFSQARLLRINEALNDVPQRLDQLVERSQKRRIESAQGLSFAATLSEQESDAESELLTLLAETDRDAAGGISFGIGDLTSQAWQSARAQFDALIAQIDRDVLHFAWVETDVAGQLIARTTIDWSGDTQTVFDAGISSNMAGLHENTLKTVTRTRQLRLRLFVTIASGSAKVAALLASPGGALLALPSVYQYVTQIAAQAGELQSIQIPQGE
jgi:hypothetical protein